MNDDSIITVVKHKQALLFDLFHTLTKVESSQSTGPLTCEVLGVSRDAWNEQVMEKSQDRLVGRITDPVLIIRKMAHAIDPAIPEETIKKAGRKNIVVKSVPITYQYRKNKNVVDVEHFTENYYEEGYKFSERGTEYLILART